MDSPETNLLSFITAMQADGLAIVSGDDLIGYDYSYGADCGGAYRFQGFDLADRQAYAAGHGASPYDTCGRILSNDPFYQVPGGVVCDGECQSFVHGDEQFQGWVTAYDHSMVKDMIDAAQATSLYFYTYYTDADSAMPVGVSVQRNNNETYHQCMERQNNVPIVTATTMDETFGVETGTFYVKQECMYFPIPRHVADEKLTVEKMVSLWVEDPNSVFDVSVFDPADTIGWATFTDSNGQCAGHSHFSQVSFATPAYFETFLEPSEPALVSGKSCNEIMNLVTDYIYGLEGPAPTFTCDSVCRSFTVADDVDKSIYTQFFDVDVTAKMFNAKMLGSTDADSDSIGGVVAGIIIVVLLVAVVVAVGVCCYWKKNKKSRQTKETPMSNISAAYSSNDGRGNYRPVPQAVAAPTPTYVNVHDPRGPPPPFHQSSPANGNVHDPPPPFSGDNTLALVDVSTPLAPASANEAAMDINPHVNASVIKDVEETMVNHGVSEDAIALLKPDGLLHATVLAQCIQMNALLDRLKELGLSVGDSINVIRAVDALGLVNE